MSRLDEIEARLNSSGLLIPEDMGPDPAQWDRVTDADLRYLLTIARAAESTHDAWLSGGYNFHEKAHEALGAALDTQPQEQKHD